MRADWEHVLRLLQRRFRLPHRAHVRTLHVPGGRPAGPLAHQRRDLQVNHANMVSYHALYGDFSGSAWLFLNTVLLQGDHGGAESGRWHGLLDDGRLRLRTRVPRRPGAMYGDFSGSAWLFLNNIQG